MLKQWTPVQTFEESEKSTLVCAFRPATTASVRDKPKKGPNRAWRCRIYSTFLFLRGRLHQFRQAHDLRLMERSTKESAIRKESGTSPKSSALRPKASLIMVNSRVRTPSPSLTGS